MAGNLTRPRISTPFAETGAVLSDVRSPNSLTFRYVERCQNCGGPSFRTWSATAHAGRLHFSQSICDSCGLVFANPVCDETTLGEYYGAQYYEAGRAEMLELPAVTEQAEPSAETELLREITKYISSGKVLDVGCGTGELLHTFRRKGFEPYGLDLSTSAVEYARRAYGLENVNATTIEEARYPDEMFDLVVTWHTIEHVLDLDRFVREIHRVLRPGGFLWIGTENYKNAFHYFDRALKVARGLPPGYATSSEHTFVFTARTLADVVQRRGFEVLETRAYQPTWANKRSRMNFRSVLTKGYFFSHHLLNQLFRTGPNLDLVACRVR